MKYLDVLGDSNRLRNQQFYQSKDWKVARKIKIEADPLCEHCETLVPAKEVDHIIPINTNWKIRLDFSNLQSLCKSCHSRKTMTENRDKMNSVGERNPMDDLLKGLIK